ARVGVLPGLAEGSGRARSVLLTSASGRSLRLGLPLAAGEYDEALGIPRMQMDAALLERAAQSGAEIVEGFEAREVRYSGGVARGVAGRERTSSAGGSFVGRVLVAADGRDSMLARLLAPAAFQGRSSA